MRCDRVDVLDLQHDDHAVVRLRDVLVDACGRNRRRGAGRSRACPSGGYLHADDRPPSPRRPSSTIGTSTPSAPMSRICLIRTASFHGTRTIGTVGEPLNAIELGLQAAVVERRRARCRSATQSKPVPAMISAITGSATEQPDAERRLAGTQALLEGEAAFRHVELPQRAARRASGLRTYSSPGCSPRERARIESMQRLAMRVLAVLVHAGRVRGEDDVVEREQRRADRRLLRGRRRCRRRRSACAFSAS